MCEVRSNACTGVCGSPRIVMTLSRSLSRSVASVAKTTAQALSQAGQERSARSAGPTTNSPSRSRLGLSPSVVRTSVLVPRAEVARHVLDHDRAELARGYQRSEQEGRRRARDRAVGQLLETLKLIHERRDHVGHGAPTSNAGACRGRIRRTTRASPQGLLHAVLDESRPRRGGTWRTLRAARRLAILGN